MLVCDWCPDTEMSFSRFLDDHICPQCRGSDCHSLEEQTDEETEMLEELQNEIDRLHSEAQKEYVTCVDPLVRIQLSAQMLTLTDIGILVMKKRSDALEKALEAVRVTA